MTQLDVLFQTHKAFHGEAIEEWPRPKLSSPLNMEKIWICQSRQLEGTSDALQSPSTRYLPFVSRGPTR